MNLELIILVLVLLVLGLPLLFIGGGLVVGVLMTRDSEERGERPRAADGAATRLKGETNQKK